MNVCEAIARWCADIETPFVAGILGNGLLEIVDRLSTDTEVPFILTRHEQGAAMMAYSYAFQTGRPAVVVASKAPGATNTAIGVMGAYVESLPMLVISAQVSNDHEGYEAFEEIDLAAFYKPITKWSVQANNPDRVPELLNEAYRRTLSGRPGPVHVAIPYNFMYREIKRYVPPAIPRAYSTIDPEQLSDVVELMTSAQRPLIIAGGGVPSGNGGDVFAIAEAFRAPIVSSWLRKPVSDRHPNVVGMAGIGGGPAARHAIHDADAVLVFGCRFSEQMTEHYRMRFADDARIVHIDLDPAVIGRVHPATIGITGDLRDLLPLLREAAVPTPISSDERTWLADLQREHADYQKSLADARTDGNAIGGREVARELRRLLPDGTRLVLDSGNYLHWAEQYFSVASGGEFHYPTSGTMGFGIPGAIGAKIAHPDAFVCALVGDGGFAMTMGELETAVRTRTPILVVIVNNSTIGHIRMRQDANFEGRRVGTNFIEQHFAHVPKAFGAFGAEVAVQDELGTVLKDAISVVEAGGIAVVDVHVTDELAAGPLVKWWHD
jgi:acetolactate synthase-1/2/3 large subunit